MWEKGSFVAICPWTAAKLTCLHRGSEGRITSPCKLLGQLGMASHFTHLKNTLLLPLTLSQRFAWGRCSKTGSFCLGWGKVRAVGWIWRNLKPGHCCGKNLHPRENSSNPASLPTDFCPSVHSSSFTTPWSELTSLQTFFKNLQFDKVLTTSSYGPLNFAGSCF